MYDGTLQSDPPPQPGDHRQTIVGIAVVVTLLLAAFLTALAVAPK